MTTSLIAYGLLVSAIAAGAAWVLDAGIRHKQWPVRGIWLGGLVLSGGLLLMTPVRRWGGDLWHSSYEYYEMAPSLVIDGASAEVVDAVELPPASVGAGVAPAHAQHAPEPSVWSQLPYMPARMIDQLQWSMPRGFDFTFTVGWVVASIAVFGLMVSVERRFRRARADWPRISVEGVDARIAADAGPAVIGVVTPEIVVPLWIMDQPVEERRLVMAHEAEHLAAGDARTLAFGSLICALMPWNVAAWWMLSRLRLAVEVDCDRRVLRRGTDPLTYGSLLIDVAGRPASWVPALGLAHRPADLAHRLKSMTAGAGPFPRTRVAVAAALALSGIALAVKSDVPALGMFEPAMTWELEAPAIGMAPATLAWPGGSYTGLDTVYAAGRGIYSAFERGVTIVIQGNGMNHLSRIRGPGAVEVYRRGAVSAGPSGAVVEYMPGKLPKAAVKYIPGRVRIVPAAAPARSKNIP